MDQDQQTEMTQEQIEEKMADRLQLFGASLGKLRDEWVKFRRNSGWDRRCQEDIDQYNSVDAANKNVESMMTTVERGHPGSSGGTTPTRSTVFIGMTRQKANAAEARLSDILLPTDERNWGIRPTPNPELQAMSEDDTPTPDPVTGAQADPITGEPVLKRDIATVEMGKARTAAQNMEREIDDQLVECDYNGEVRKVIHDSAVMGTGVLKGPVVTNRTRRSWQKMQDQTGSVYVLEMQEETRPASFRVDPRNVFEDPACGDDIQNGRGIFERDLKTPKLIRALAKQPGYLKSQLRLVLEQGPRSSATMEEAGDDEHKREQHRNNFEVWEYWGEIDPEDARAAGVTVKDDVLDSISACVVLINNVVVKVFPNPLDSGELPYDFLPWEKIPDQVRGFGVPRLMNAQQRVMNAAWRGMMDNGGISSGPQIILKPKLIRPADGQMNITPRKLWYCDDVNADVSQAFTAVEFNSRQSELAAIIEMATKLADEETAVPLLAQGQERNIPDTVGGMQMLMQSANVVLRRVVKQFDDCVTKPHIRRYYDYNMLYGEDDSIKGDYEIDARGSSAMVVRDIRNQALMQLLGAATNPAFQPLIDTKKLFEKALEAQHVDPRDIMLADEVIEANKKAQAQQPPPNPALQVAQLRAEAEMARTKLTQESDVQELQLKRDLMTQDREFRLQELTLQQQIEVLKLAQTKELTLEQIRASLADTAMKERSKAQLFNAEANLKLQTGQGI